MDIEWQSAGAIVNVEFRREPARDHGGCGIALLRQGHYAAAVRELAQAVEADPADNEAHYYLALALLDGARPHRSPRRVVESVRRHLDTARALPEARVLRVLVDEDHELLWRLYPATPQALVDLVDQVDWERALEIIRHVPAREARTFQVLERAVTTP